MVLLVFLAMDRVVNHWGTQSLNKFVAHLTRTLQHAMLHYLEALNSGIPTTPPNSSSSRRVAACDLLETILRTRTRLQWVLRMMRFLNLLKHVQITCVLLVVCVNVLMAQQQK